MNTSAVARSPAAPSAPPFERVFDGVVRVDVAPTDGRTASGHRVDYVDGLRALAALWVALHHAAETSVPTEALRAPIAGPIVASLFFGQSAVVVFLILTGFCLYYPCAKKRPAGPTLSTPYATYLLRRATRIAPPYLCAGALCLGLAVVPQLQCGRWSGVGTTSGSVILSHLLMLHNLVPSHAAKIDYPMWTIGLEWQLYLLFPLLVWFFRRSRGVYVTAALLAVAVVARGTNRLMPEIPGAVVGRGPLSYLVVMAIGMMAAAMTAQNRTIGPRWVLRALALLGFAVVRVSSGGGLVHDLAASCGAFCVLLLAADAGSLTSHLLSNRALVRIGIFSYSIYLVHAPLLHICWFALRPLQLSSDRLFFVLAMLCLPVIVLVAYGFHRLFERPFMRSKPALSLP